MQMDRAQFAAAVLAKTKTAKKKSTAVIADDVAENKSHGGTKRKIDDDDRLSTPAATTTATTTVPTATTTPTAAKRPRKTAAAPPTQKRKVAVAETNTTTVVESDTRTDDTKTYIRGHISRLNWSAVVPSDPRLAELVADENSMIEVVVNYIVAKVMKAAPTHARLIASGASSKTKSAARAAVEMSGFLRNGETSQSLAWIYKVSSHAITVGLTSLIVDCFKGADLEFDHPSEEVLMKTDSRLSSCRGRMYSGVCDRYHCPKCRSKNVFYIGPVTRRTSDEASFVFLICECGHKFTV